MKNLLFDAKCQHLSFGYQLFIDKMRPQNETAVFSCFLPYYLDKSSEHYRIITNRVSNESFLQVTKRLKIMIFVYKTLKKLRPFFYFCFNFNNIVFFSIFDYNGKFLGRLISNIIWFCISKKHSFKN